MMGAIDLVRIYRCSRSDLERMVENDRANDGHEDGHSYSGSWGSKYGSLIISNEVFISALEARKYVIEKSPKFDPLVAARFVEATQQRGYGAINRLIEKYNKLDAKCARFGEDSLARKAVDRAKAAKSKTRSCPACSARHEVSKLHEPYCPGCGEPFLLTRTDKERLERTQIERRDAADELRRAIRSAPKDAPIFAWVAGGECPS